MEDVAEPIDKELETEPAYNDFTNNLGDYGENYNEFGLQDHELVSYAKDDYTLMDVEEEYNNTTLHPCADE